MLTDQLTSKGKYQMPISLAQYIYFPIIKSHEVAKSDS